MVMARVMRVVMVMAMVVMVMVVMVTRSSCRHSREERHLLGSETHT